MWMIYIYQFSLFHKANLYAHMAWWWICCERAMIHRSALKILSQHLHPYTTRIYSAFVFISGLMRSVPSRLSLISVRYFIQKHLADKILTFFSSSLRVFSVAWLLCGKLSDNLHLVAVQHKHSHTHTCNSWSYEANNYTMLSW